MAITNSSNLTYTIPINNSSSNQIYVIAGGGGGGGTTWSNTTSSPTTHFTNGKGKAVLEIPNTDTPAIKITGNIEWNGENLNERLERIETVLNIPTRDVIMEGKYTKLRELSNQYKQALEEYKTWERLKNSK